MDSTEETNKINKIRDFVRSKRPDLVMTRVPIKALKEFKDFADENFTRKDGVSDYGMALKYLMDSYSDRVKTLENFNDIFASINMIHKRLSLLEDEQDSKESLEDSTRIINLLNGHKIEVDKKR